MGQFASLPEESQAGTMIWTVRVSNILGAADSRDDSRWITGKINSYRLQARIVNVYSPNDPSLRRGKLEELEEYLDGIPPGSELILGGDWNVVEDP